MEVALVTSAESLSALEPEWLDLWRRTPDATPFQSPMWLLPWWRHFGSNDLSVIAFRHDGRLAGLAPLYVVRDEDESLGLLMGTGSSDYLDVLGDVTGIADSLRKIDCQLWDLQQLRPFSPLLHMPLPEGWSDNVIDHDSCLLLSIEDGGGDLENLISTHFRKKLRYYRRTLERLGTLSCEAANRGNLDALIDALYALHAARWGRRGMPGMLADDVVQRFHREVARAMLDAGALRMYAMRVEERIVALFYGFAHQHTVCYYLSGYDPDLEKSSPGTLIVAHAIEQALCDGAVTFDFLRGAEEYKYAWGSKDRINRRRQLFPAG